jgi:tyrosinase
LYVQRSGTNVYNALDLSPFASTVWNFQRGTTNAFETKIESAPHNPVHNLIGGIMATMQSPQDPIFYLHHANIDRLTHAWALPDGKGIPYTANPYSSSNSSPYWAGSFTYASTLTMERYRTYYPGWLGYDYANDNKPTSLPPQTKADRINDPRNPFKMVQAQIAPILDRPPVGGFASAPARTLAANRRSLGGATNVGLDENSISAGVQLQAADARLLQNIVSAAKGTGVQAPVEGYRSAKVVLDNVVVAGAGRNGGYFYNLYINLPASGDLTSVRQQHFLGTVGAFEVAGMAHHGPASLQFPATEILANMSAADLADITLSFVRVNGQNAPKGQVMRIGEVRVEISSDDPWDRSAPTPRPANACYC